MYKIGDKVRLIKGYGYVKKGEKGIIRALPGNNGAFMHYYSVEFPAWKKSQGHTCGGTVPSGKGQWVLPECLELIEERQPRIGDRIEMIKKRNGVEKGLTGRIVDIRSNSPLPYGVEFDKKFDGGHGCSGACKHGYGQWVAGDDFEVITESEPAQKIVIIHDGKTTTAKLYEGKEVTKTAEANCSPDDKFDFATGAKLAFEWLMGVETQEPPKFDKSILTTGRFGYMEEHGWFVVVGNKIIYEKGGYDLIEKMTFSGRYPSGYGVKYIVDACSFRDAKSTLHKAIWCAPGFAIWPVRE